MTASIVILQMAVLAVVLESDLGRRKIGWFRVLRPVVTVVAIVPFFFTTLPTARDDLILQAAGALAFSSRTGARCLAGRHYPGERQHEQPVVVA